MLDSVLLGLVFHAREVEELPIGATRAIVNGIIGESGRAVMGKRPSFETHHFFAPPFPCTSPSRVLSSSTRCFSTGWKVIGRHACPSIQKHNLTSLQRSNISGFMVPNGCSRK
jgi:hypothetical protein